MGTLVSMDYREFRRLREGVTTNLPPANDTLLTAAATKLRNRLASSAMFADVLVEKTEDIERLLVAGVRYRPGAAVQQVCSHLEAIWVTELRLPGLDAFNFHTQDGHIELESVTGDKASGYFLTLHVLAEEGTAEIFEQRRAATKETAGEKSTEEKKSRWFRR